MYMDASVMYITWKLWYGHSPLRNDPVSVTLSQVCSLRELSVADLPENDVLLPR